MIYCHFIVFFLCFTLSVGSFQFSADYLSNLHLSDNDGDTKFIFSTLADESESWLVNCTYCKTYLETGWNTLDIITNPSLPDEKQAFIAGYVEGLVTHEAIYDHWYNTIRWACENNTQLCERVGSYLEANNQWVSEMVHKYNSTDAYWQQVQLFYWQLFGLFEGYQKAAPSDKQEPLQNLFWMTFIWDIGDLMSALNKEINKDLKGDGHCSALIKILPNMSDILVSQENWGGLNAMLRIMKKYTFNFKNVQGSSMSFSSYPGALISGDDFYIINSGLVTQETTIGNNNASLWPLVLPQQVLEAVRVMVSNRLAKDGREWTKIFSQHNSGTYNNQWMIVDMKKFSPGESIQPGLLWVVEQIPGYIRGEDQTNLLKRQGYWASYNRPFYPDIFNMSGNQPLVQKYGDFFSYEKAPRALMFKRDHVKVKDIHTMMQVMRSNDYKHDPLSRCNCNPPYSAENAIASRGDLNPINGTYPFPALGHRNQGATDAKITNYNMAKSLAIFAVCGPSTGTGLPPFQWSKSADLKALPHRGHPDLFHFDPIFITWNKHTSGQSQPPSVQLLP